LNAAIAIAGPVESHPVGNLVALAVVMVVVTELSYRLVETPLRDYGRRLAAGLRAA